MPKGGSDSDARAPATSIDVSAAVISSVFMKSRGEWSRRARFAV
jgi:hypothetical protein